MDRVLIILEIVEVLDLEGLLHKVMVLEVMEEEIMEEAEGPVHILKF